MFKKRLRSPIEYYGGKGNLVGKLLKYIPEHRYYIEVFGGGASLLFAKKPAEFEVYNDKWEIVVNFFRVLRDDEKFKEFYRLVCLTPYARAEYRYSKSKLRDYIEGKEGLKEDLNEVEVAYYFFVCARQSFSGGILGGWSYNVKATHRNMTGTVSRYLSCIDGLPEIHARLMRVQIECLDWKECLEKYSGYEFEEEFIYLDPPYLPETRRSKDNYVCEMSYEEHEELIDYLLTKRRRVMLSGYDNELYQKLER